jgi:crossover junction endodeoxyribonuclease RuvC
VAEPSARGAQLSAARRVFGVDPGTRVVGWAVLSAGADGTHALTSGTWRLGGSDLPLPQRLHRLHQMLSAMLQLHQPTELALEAAFVGPNVRSALRLGEARGVVMMTAAAAGLPVEEIPPATVKRRVAGAGAASKEQVERLVRMRLGLPHLKFSTADESDAVAVAFCALLAGQGRAGGVPASAGIRTRRGRAALPAGARLQA